MKAIACPVYISPRTGEEFVPGGQAVVPGGQAVLLGRQDPPADNPAG